MKTTTQRGYGADHQKKREKWKKLLAKAGQIPCARCSKPIMTTDKWELDHSDDRQTYIGISHEVCNRRAGWQRSQQIKNAGGPVVRRGW